MTSIFSTEERGGIAGNLAYAVVAQGIGLLSSILTSLVLPKFLGVEDYAYWQLFLLYSSYSGFALLGLNDGIYLRLGGKRYSEVNHGELKAQQCVVAVSQLFVAACCLAAVLAAGFEPYRSLVLALCVFFGLLTNLTQCLRYVFQCTNLTRISSLADLFSKGLFVAFMVTVLLAGVDSSRPFIMGYIACQALAFLYVLICARSTLRAKAAFKGVLRTCADDVRAGLKVMVAYYADSLIVGFTRMLTDWQLGLTAFGKLSLSFSLTNFVLGFIGQVSMVAFPVLKRLDADGRREKYLAIRLLLHTALPCAYLLYVPVKLVLGLWLPAYSESLVYLALTMPLCVYSCKANLLFNTYLKMGRRGICVHPVGATRGDTVHGERCRHDPERGAGPCEHRWPGECGVGDMRDCGLGGGARPCFRVDHIAQVWKSRGAILCFGGLDYHRVHDGVVVFGRVELACGADDAGCIPMVRQRRRKVGYDGGEKEARASVSLR